MLTSEEELEFGGSAASVTKRINAITVWSCSKFISAL